MRVSAIGSDISIAHLDNQIYYDLLRGMIMINQFNRKHLM